MEKILITSPILKLNTFIPEIFHDYRGEYVETWNKKYAQRFLPKREFIQDDISTSHKHVLRGLHGDNETWKLVQCLQGSMLLCVVNFRHGDVNYLKHEFFSINDRNRMQVLIPPSHANGHLVLSDGGIFHYKQTTLYEGAGKQFTLRWDDPKLNIPWPIKNPILSSRDRNAKLLN